MKGGVYDIAAFLIAFLKFTFTFPWPPSHMEEDVRKYVPTTHHLVPRSRCRSLGLYPHDRKNLMTLNGVKHEAFHALFSNMTPEEVLIYIANNFVPDLDYYGEHIKNKAVYRFLVAIKDPMGSR